MVLGPSTKMVQLQGDHLSGKPGNVMEFDSCQGNVRDFTANQGIVREKILSGKSCLKLFIVNCIPVSIHAFSRSLLCLKCLVYGFRSCAVAFLHPPLTVTLVRHDMSNT